MSLGSGWKFFYTLAMPLVWCWIPFVTGKDTLFGSHLYLFTLVSSLFLVHSIPLVVSAMVIVVMLPLLKLQDAKMAASNVMREQAMLILGQMALGCAIVTCNLHKRIALMILQLTGNAHARIVSAVYFLTIIFAIVISGPTSAFIMLATSQSLSNEREDISSKSDEIPDEASTNSSHVSTSEDPQIIADKPDDTDAEEPEVANSPSEEPAIELNENVEGDDSKSDAAPSVYKEPERESGPVLTKDTTESLDRELRKRYFITVYIAANIGGLLFPHTSPGVSLLYDYTDSRNRTIAWGPSISKATFVQVQLQTQKSLVEMNMLHWLQFAAPIAIALALISWIYLLIIFEILAPLEQNSGLRLIGKRSVPDVALLREERSFYQRKLADIGRIDIHQILVMIMTACVVILWLTRDPRFFDGWSRKVVDRKNPKLDPCLESFVKTDKTSIKAGDTSVIFLFIVLMFMVPRFTNKPSDRKPLAILVWKFLEGQIFWNVVIMFGCQFAFSESSLSSNLEVITRSTDGVTNCTTITNVGHDGFRGEVEKWLSNIDNASLNWIVTGIVAIASELFGGVAISNIFLYILSTKRSVPSFYPSEKTVRILNAGSQRFPGQLGLPVTAKSCLCFMFPVATATNAIVFSLGTLTGCMGMLDMIMYGAFLDLISWLLVTCRYEIYAKYEA